MARARMIKPDFSDDEKMATVSGMARLVYILLWPQSDDYGVVKGNPRWIKTRLFPYDDFTVAQITEWLLELEQLGRLCKFDHNGEVYYYMPKFLVHQRIEKPSKTRNPEPPESVLGEVGDESVSSRLPVGECSLDSSKPVGDEVELEEERELELTESKDSEAVASQIEQRNKRSVNQQDFDVIVEYLQERFGIKTANSVLYSQAGAIYKSLRRLGTTGDEMVWMLSNRLSNPKSVAGLIEYIQKINVDSKLEMVSEARRNVGPKHVRA